MADSVNIKRLILQGVIVSADKRLFLPLNPTHWTFNRKHRISDKTQQVKDNKIKINQVVLGVFGDGLELQPPV